MAAYLVGTDIGTSGTKSIVLVGILIGPVDPVDLFLQMQ
jgi:hypothetical protein